MSEVDAAQAREVLKLAEDSEEAAIAGNKSVALDVEDGGEWTCSTCTYANTADLQECTMCGTPRNAPPAQPNEPPVRRADTEPVVIQQMSSKMETFELEQSPPKAAKTNELPPARIVVDRGPSPSEGSDCRQSFYKTCGFITLAVVIIMIGFLGASFSRLQYYEYGMLQSRLTGIVTRSKVYGPGGMWNLGPDGIFVTFPSNVQQVRLDDMGIWSKSSRGSAKVGNTSATEESAGTALTIDLSYQYTINKDQLDKLFEKRTLDYKPLVENVAYQAIKNTCILQTADEFLKSRPKIEAELTAAITKALAKEAHVILEGVQLRRVEFPNSYVARKLAVAVQDLRNDEQDYERISALTRQTTTTEAQFIKNTARKVETLAMAEAALIKMRAENTGIKLVQKARSDGLKETKDTLNITKVEHTLSLDYMVQVAGAGNGQTTYVNFPKLLVTV